MLKWDAPELLTEAQVNRIGQIGMSRVPAEACGILLPEFWGGRDIFEMPNRSLNAEHEFVLHQEDVLYELYEWMKATQEEQLKRMTIWHTHPGGGVGPSRIDMRNKVKDAFHLVITITDVGAFIPTWY